MKEQTAHLFQKKGSVEVDGFVIQVIVTDVRQAFGRTDLLVKATGATGEKWFSEGKVRLEEAV